jgi:hypothetical protein
VFSVTARLSSQQGRQHVGGTTKRSTHDGVALAGASSMQGPTRGGVFSTTHDGAQAGEARTRGAGERDMSFLRGAPKMPQLCDIDPRTTRCLGRTQRARASSSTHVATPLASLRAGTNETEGEDRRSGRFRVVESCHPRRGARLVASHVCECCPFVDGPLTPLRHRGFRGACPRAVSLHRR